MDLSQVDFLDSGGVQVLVDGYHSVMVAGGTLTVRGARGTPARVPHLGPAQLFGVVPLLGVVPRDWDTDGPTPSESQRPG